jgi:hypothetical protein
MFSRCSLHAAAACGTTLALSQPNAQNHNGGCGPLCGAKDCRGSSGGSLIGGDFRGAGQCHCCTWQPALPSGGPQQRTPESTRLKGSITIDALKSCCGWMHYHAAMGDQKVREKTPHQQQAADGRNRSEPACMYCVEPWLLIARILQLVPSSSIARRSLCWLVSQTRWPVRTICFQQ